MGSDMIELIIDDAADMMDKAVTHTRQDFAGVRTGRAAPGLVEKLPIEYYGSEVPLQQIATCSVPEARLLVVSPYDKRDVAAIEKAIQASDLGLNPSNDGQVIRLAFPPLTEERRRELVKVVRAMAEDGKVALRNLRRSARHDLESSEKDGDMSADELQRAEKELDEIVHGHEGKIGRVLEEKETELLED